MPRGDAARRVTSDSRQMRPAGVWSGGRGVVKCGFWSVEYVAIVMTAVALIGIVMMAAAVTVAVITVVRYSFALSGIKKDEKEFNSIDSQFAFAYYCHGDDKEMIIFTL